MWPKATFIGMNRHQPLVQSPVLIIHPWLGFCLTNEPVINKKPSASVLQSFKHWPARSRPGWVLHHHLEEACSIKLSNQNLCLVKKLSCNPHIFQCQVTIYSAKCSWYVMIKSCHHGSLNLQSFTRACTFSLLCHKMKPHLTALFFCLNDSHRGSLSSPLSIHLPLLPSLPPLQSSVTFPLSHYQNRFTMQKQQLAASCLRRRTCLS